MLPACNERLLTPVVTEAQASRFVQDPDFVGNALSLVDTRNLPASTTDIVFDPLEHAWFSSREGYLFRYDGTRIWSYALGANAIMDLEMLEELVVIDVSGDGMIGTADILNVIADLGCNIFEPDCYESDFNFNTTVGTDDLLMILANFGQDVM